MRKIVAFSEACHTSQETVTVCVICNHSASQDIISPSKCRHQTTFPPLEVIQLLVHAVVSCGKCHILFRTAIVILLAPLTKRHFRHNSGFSLFCIVWFICTTQRVGVGAWGNEYLDAKADGQACEGGLSGTGETSVCSSGVGITEGQDGTVSSLGLPWKALQLDSHGHRRKRHKALESPEGDTCFTYQPACALRIAAE